MKSQSGSDAASTYWRSVEQAAASPNEIKARRANELLRLRAVADGYRSEWFKDQPELTIDADDSMGGRANAAVSKLGGWGQGLSIKVKASRIDPFHWSPAVDDAPEMAIKAKDKSLIFGLPLRRNTHGEKLRRFEAELIVLQQLLRAEQHRIVEIQGNGHGAAKSDLNSWGGFGDWFANEASKVWLDWCEANSYPFVPVRHSRSGYEETHSCIAPFEDAPIDGILTKFRPSCSQWPMVAMSQTRDPIAEGDAPADAPEITPEVWERWKREQAELSSAMAKRVGKETMLLGVAWTKGQLPQIDEVEGEPVVQLPTITAAIPQSQKVTLNFNAADGLQTVEAVFTRIDRERGLTLWSEFLQLASDHPQSPKASKVQTALAVDLDDDEPTPIEAGDKPAPAADPNPVEAKPVITELNGFELLQAVRHKLHGQGVITHLWKSFGLGNAGVDFNGTPKIVGLGELTPIEADESFTAQRWPTTDGPELTPIEAGGLSESEPEQGADLRADNPKVENDPIDSTPDNPEPSQSQLRKQADHDGLPAWPVSSRSQGKGQRVRLTNEQAVLVDGQIERRLMQGFKPSAIADALMPWCGQQRTGLLTRIRNVRTRIEAGQEVAA